MNNMDAKKDAPAKATLINEDAQLKDVVSKVLRGSTGMNAFVVDDAGRLKGVIRIWDLLEAAMAHERESINTDLPAGVMSSDYMNRFALSKKAKDMMQPVLAVKPDQSLKRAHELMAENHVSELPVVDENDHIIGEISVADILSMVESEEAVAEMPIEKVLMEKRRSVSPVVNEDAQLSEVVENVIKKTNALDVFVTDKDNRLKGILRVWDMLDASAEKHKEFFGMDMPSALFLSRYAHRGRTVKELMHQPVFVGPKATTHEACMKMRLHHLSSLPVVDKRGKLLGSISMPKAVLRAWKNRKAE